MSTSPVCNHIYCHLWAECWSPSYASFPPPWPSITPPPAPRSSTSDIYTDSGHWLMTLNTYYTSHILGHTHCNDSFYSFPQTITSTININVQCYLCLESSMSPFHLTHPPYSNWGWFASFSSKLTEANLYPASNPTIHFKYYLDRSKSFGSSVALQHSASYNAFCL